MKFNAFYNGRYAMREDIRFVSNAKKLSIPIIYSNEELLGIFTELIGQFGDGEFFLYFQLTRRKSDGGQANMRIYALRFYEKHQIMNVLTHKNN